MLLPLELQKEAAQKALDDFTRKAKADFATVAGSSNKVNDSLEQMAASTKKIEFGQALDRGLSKFGDLKDIVEKAGASVFGLSEEMAVAAGASLDMSQKVASLGSLFGPLGVGIGAVVGGLIGYVSATKDSTASVKAATDAVKAHNEALKLEQLLLSDTVDVQKAYQKLLAATSSDEFGLFGKNKDQLVDGLIDINDEIKKLRANAEQSAAGFKELSEAGIGNTETVRDEKKFVVDLAEQIAALDRKKAAYQKTLDDLTPKVKNFTAALKEQSAGIQGATISVDIDKIKQDQDNILLERFEKQESYNARIEQASTDHYQRVAANRKKIEEQDAKDAEQLRLATLDSYESQLSRVTSITSQLTAQLEENVASGAKLFNDFGIAAERGVSEVLKALSREWTVKAIGETAEGLAALASQRYKSAGEHFASAAGFGAAAVAAGVGGAVVGGDASRRANASEGGTGGGTNGGPSDSRISDPGTQNLTPIVIEFKTTVPMTERQYQEAAQNIEGFLKKLRR